MTDNIKLGELLNERSLYSKTFMNFDGSRTVEIHADAIHFQDSDGNYHNIDTTLYDEADFSKYSDVIEASGEDIFYNVKAEVEDEVEQGGIDRDSYDFQGLKVPFVTRVPRIFNRGYMIGDGQETLIFKPLSASPSRGYVEPTNRSIIRYQDVWNDTDVKLELKKDGLKETIILKSAKAPSTFLFEVEGSLSDDLRAGNMRLTPAWLKDANGTYKDVSQEIKIDEDSGALYIVLDVDTDNLVYPIYVDPTIVVSQTANSSNQIDNEIRQSSPTTVSVNPSVGSINTGDTIRFMSKYPTLKSLIPDKAQIISANLRLRPFSTSGGGTVSAIAVPITNDYNVNAVTWNNQPTYSMGMATPVVTNLNDYSAFNFDVKAILQAMADGTSVYGFMVKSVPPTDSGETIGFALSSNSNAVYRPVLTFTYNSPPSKPTLTSPNGGEVWNSIETVRWNASNDVKDVSYAPIPYSRELTFSSRSSAGQVFTITEDNAILKKVSLLLRVLENTEQYTMILAKAKKVSGDIGWAYDDTQILAQQDVMIPDASKSQWVDLPLPSIPMPKGTALAVYIKNKIGKFVTFNLSIGDIYYPPSDGNMIIDNLVRSENMVFRVEYTTGTPTNQLTYQIQLSSDNGGTWKTIINATSAGATAQAYDFKNEVESSTSRIRVRAYDGFVYGDWDESDGVFTILHNQAPNMPTDLAPNGTIEDRGTSIRMSWKHNDPNGVDPQSKFDLQWRVQGSANWTTVTQSTTNQFYNAPVNLFPANSKIEWRVRTYDQAGLAGQYSNVALFTAAVRTTPPTVTYPTNGAVVPISRPTFQWSHPNQVKFWVRVKVTSTGAIFYDFSATAANKAITINKDLANNTGYTLEVAVMDENGLWSTFTSVPFQVSYTAPNKPVVTFELDNDRGWTTLNIDSATINGMTPATIYYDIFRKGDNGEWIKLVDGLSAVGTSYSKPFAITADFDKKILNSNVENPNNSLQSVNPSILSPLAEGWIDWSQAGYVGMYKLDGVTSTSRGDKTLQMAQQVFIFNTLEIIERSLGVQVWRGKTSLSDKRAIAIDILTKLTWAWWGYGSGAIGSFAQSRRWSRTASSWVDSVSHTLGQVSPLSLNPAYNGDDLIHVEGQSFLGVNGPVAARANLLPDATQAGNGLTGWKYSSAYTANGARGFNITPTIVGDECWVETAVLPNTQYTGLTNTSHADLRWTMTYLDGNRQEVGASGSYRDSYTFTTPPNCYIIRFRLRNWSLVNGTFTNIALVQGSTIPSDVNTLIPTRISTDYVKMNLEGAETGTRVQWIDRTPNPTKEEQYFVRAYGTNGTVTDSDVVRATVQLKHVQIALASDPTQYVTLNKREAGKEKSTRKSVTTDYVGRLYPLTEFSDNYSKEFAYTYKVYNYSDVEMMRSLIYAGEALLLRDNWGRKDYVTIDTVDIQEARIQWNLTINPIKIYYMEGIL